MIRFALFILVFLSTQNIFACKSGKKTLSALNFTGNSKTEKSVLEREYELKQGECVDTEMLAAALQRIRNTNLFAKAEMKLIENADFFEVSVSVVERWTLNPIMKFGGGGGVSYVAIGAYDPHVMGKNFELGAQYENLGGAPSQVVWFRKPRVLGKRLRIGGDLWNVTRNRLVYDKDRNEIGGFTLQRRRLHLFMDYEVVDFVKPYLAIDYQEDQTSQKSISEDSRETNLKTGFNPYTKSIYLIPRIGIIVGRMNIYEELVEGSLVDFQIEPVRDYGDHLTFVRSRLEAQYAKRVMKRSNWAQRLIGSTQASHDLSQSYYLGSMQDVRGLLDSQFQTNKYVSLNSEFRTPSVVKSYLIQHAFFTDLVTFGSKNKWREAYSVGTGVRFIFPKIYRLNLRLDWAKSFGYGEGSAISFGLQQFF